MIPNLNRFTKENITKKQNSKKGATYDKLKSMYDSSLPMSLAFYASDKRSKEWNKGFFDTKVDQRAYFECMCGGTEENKKVVGYRVQCRDCGNEQHAECVNYDLEDPYRGEYVCPHCWVQAEKAGVYISFLCNGFEENLRKKIISLVSRSESFY